MHKIRILHQNLWIANLQRVTCVFRVVKRFHTTISPQSHMEIFVNGMAESMAKSRFDGATPASTRLTPSMATMAPLSVHSLSCGTRTSTPCSTPTSNSLARSCEFAEKPPPTINVFDPYCSQPRIAFLASTVATESANDAHTSSTGISLPCACCSSIQRATAVFPLCLG